MISVHQISNMGELVRIMIRGTEGFNPQPTNIGDHTVTYGYGYTFIRRGRNGWEIYENLDEDLAAIGITLTPAENTQLQSIVAALNQNNLALADQRIAQFAQNWQYVDLTPTEAQTLYNQQLSHDAIAIRARFQKYLGSTDGDALFTALQNTQEMAVMLDMAYNGGAGLIGKKLINAMWNGNRAEAWFEIRYNSNGGSTRSRGIANRRYEESDLFGLLDSGAFTDEETKEVFRMFTKHQSEINDYEKAYPSPSSSAIALYTQVLQAKEYLVNKFGQGKSIDEIIVGAGLQSYEYLETWSIDKIEGTNGNDLIFGEKGSDILDGGAGDDQLFGENKGEIEIMRRAA